SLEQVRQRLDEMEQDAIGEIIDECVPSTHLSATRTLDLRYRGVDASLAIDWPANGDFDAAFSNAHRRRYGYVHMGRPLEIAAARVEVVGHVADALPARAHASANARNDENATKRVQQGVYFDGERF